MIEKSVTIQQGEESSTLKVYTQLSQELKQYFKAVESTDEFNRFFGGQTTIATKNIKVTLLIEEL